MRELFLLDPGIVFLIHGSFGACPRSVFEVDQARQRDLERQPVEFLGRRSAALLEESRHRLAAHLRADPDHLVYITNTTTGVNTVARSLHLRQGDEVLTTDHEYGACDNVWELVCRRAGASYVKRRLPLPLPDSSEVVEILWSAVTTATRVIYLSHITSTTALVVPVAEICRRARREGILTVVDGAHAPGQLPLDLEAVGADVYIGNCHKWLCAPKGAAFLHVRPEYHLLFDAAVVSWGYPGAVIAIQTFGDFLGFNPHCHVLVTDGCFYGRGMFRVAPPLGLSEVSGNHADHQLHRRPGGHPDHPETPPPLSLGRLPSVVKIRNTGREESVCPDEPPKRLPDLGKSLKSLHRHLLGCPNPENPPKPR